MQPWLKYLLAFWLFIMVGAAIIMRVRFRRAFRKKDELRRCICGYVLEHLEVPRCPECGTLVGFKNVRPEDIGLTEEEMRAHAQKKRQAREEKSGKN